MNWLPSHLGSDTDPPSMLGPRRVVAGQFDGKHVPRPIRTNNPGAIKDFGYDWKGLIDRPDIEHAGMPAGKHCVFETPEYGFRAMTMNLLNGYFRKRNLRTIRQIVERYAPRNHDNNSTDYYISYLTERLGWDADSTIPEQPQYIAPLVAAMAELECGYQDWWSKRQIQTGVAMVMGGTVVTPQAPVPTPTPKPKPPHDPALDGPLAGTRTMLSGAAMAAAPVGSTVLTQIDKPGMAELMDRLFWVALAAMVLFFALKVLRIWRDK